MQRSPALFRLTPILILTDRNCYIAQSAIDIILSSDRLYMTLCIVALRVGVRGSKLYHRVPSGALPIHFFRHFCWGMYRSATKHSERIKMTGINIRLPASKTDFIFETVNKYTRANHGYSSQRSVAIPYVVRSTIGYHSNSWASCIVIEICQASLWIRHMYANVFTQRIVIRIWDTAVIMIMCC